jgi:glycosyltransferase involved in cell wall biosynthesis
MPERDVANIDGGLTMLEDITPLVITYDEAANIERTLDRLVWARRIVVIDSGSTDETVEIIRTYRQAEVIHRPFDDFAGQCNFGIAQVTTAWVLSLDADYELSEALVTELRSLRPDASISGYRVRFIYRIYGRPLRGTLYPPRIVLYRRDRASYRNEGHGHHVVVAGKIAPLSGVIFHDDRKPFARWIASQQGYARREAEHLLSSDRKALEPTDRIRLAAWPAPIAAFIYTLFFKGCLLDGWQGWYYALQRLLAETMLALEVVDRRLRRDVPPSGRGI